MYHAATHHPPVDVGDENAGPTTTPEPEYFGTVTDTHIATVWELAADPAVPRIIKNHPRDPNQFYVIRDDGFLDHYVRVEEGE